MELPFVESEIERLVQTVLSSPLDQPLADSVRPAFRAAPVGYLPMLPVPIWPDFKQLDDPGASDREDLPSEGGDHQTASRPSQEARRTKDADDRKRNPLVINRF
ncbi:hypothetical protein RJJ37_05160 [Rhizobium redzepovicii]|uniref:Uncharacterized protein n=1 Tax=Rhizobium redzepovicii TaxID=2867518 RepID=A0AAW8NWH2_9HYPH|nr:hypothetical protein [Rhizobium redzepovicii]MDR9759026.1 hypothetical protein [Rhizobium redzepovicii]